MIRLDDVGKYFVKRGVAVKALDGVSLYVPAGKFALLRGPSGSGKTTLVNVAAGLTRPTRGRATVAGASLGDLSPGARARLRAKKVAVVFQLFHLVPYLTAFENALLPTLAGTVRDAGDRANDLLAQLGIANRAGHLPGEMSAGERQRCALARALLARPEVILADEPTGNLDEESARLVLRMLAACRDEGATVLLVSHQPLAEIAPDLTFELHEGRLPAEADGNSAGS